MLVANKTILVLVQLLYILISQLELPLHTSLSSYCTLLANPRFHAWIPLAMATTTLMMTSLFML